MSDDHVILSAFLFFLSFLLFCAVIVSLGPPAPMPHYVDPCPGHHIKNLCD